MTNAEIFRKAADYIREHGWIQGGYYNGPGNVCLVGAVARALGEGIKTPKLLVAPSRVSSSAAMNRLVDVLGADGMWEVAQWNDKRERTVEEVITLLDGLAFDEDLKAAATAHTLDTPTPETGGLVSQPQPSPSLLKEAVLA